MCTAVLVSSGCGFFCKGQNGDAKYEITHPLNSYASLYRGKGFIWSLSLQLYLVYIPVFPDAPLDQSFPPPALPHLPQRAPSFNFCVRCSVPPGHSAPATVLICPGPDLTMHGPETVLTAAQKKKAAAKMDKIGCTETEKRQWFYPMLNSPEEHERLANDNPYQPKAKYRDEIVKGRWKTQWQKKRKGGYKSRRQKERSLCSCLCL